MATQLKTFYRIEHPIDKKGFYHSKKALKPSGKYSATVKLIGKIMSKVEVLFYDEGLIAKVNSETELYQYKCGFISFNQMIELFHMDYLKFFVERGFSIVEIKAPVLIGNTQVAFQDNDTLVRKELSLKCIEKRLAKLTAKKDLLEEFKTLNASNYIVLN